MGKTHPAFDLVSAYSDGELDAARAETVRRHLADCHACQADLRALGALEAALVATPALPCASARPLVSAALDGEILPEETPLLAQHLAGCAGCAADRAVWVALESDIKALPWALPPARVDAAIAKLVDRHERTRIWALPVVPLALRGLTVTALVALVVALSVLSGHGGPQQANAPSSAIVASALSVLDTRTNTLYVVDPATGTLRAIDAATNAEISRVTVGGNPTAIALNTAANTVVILDGGRKSVVEVDTARRAVVSSVTVDMPGTPTSLQVESSGRVFVGATTPQGGGKTTGSVAIVDNGKSVGVVSVDVAPQRMVLEPTGGRVLLVSPTGTTLADAKSLAPLDRLAGGVGAAFSATSNGGAILGASAGGARITFWGAKAAPGLDLDGTPLAIAALPDGSYGVLLTSGRAERIAVVSAAGELQSSVDVAGAGTDLSFDAAIGRFAVVGSGATVSFVARPAPATAQQPSATNPPATQAPNTTAPTPTASPTPSPTPTGAPTLVPSTPAPSATALGGSTQFAIPGGRQAFLARAAAGRIWFVDQFNKLNALITADRSVFTFVQLPNDAIIRGLAVSPNYVYAIDSHSGLTVFSITSERAVTQMLSFLPANGVLAATALDDRIWFAKPGGHQLFSYEPLLKQVVVVEIADASLSALATDDGGRIWFANESRKSVGYYDTLTARVVEFPVARRGNVTALLPTAGTVWAGTDVGELLTIRGDHLAFSASAGAAITALAMGPGGVWYMAGSSGGAVFAPLSGTVQPRVAPASVRSLTFDRAGEAWLSDPSAALFYVIDTGVR